MHTHMHMVQYLFGEVGAPEDLVDRLGGGRVGPEPVASGRRRGLLEKRVGGQRHLQHRVGEALRGMVLERHDQLCLGGRNDPLLGEAGRERARGAGQGVAAAQQTEHGHDEANEEEATHDEDTWILICCGYCVCLHPFIHSFSESVSEHLSWWHAGRTGLQTGGGRGDRAKKASMGSAAHQASRLKGSIKTHSLLNVKANGPSIRWTFKNRGQKDAHKAPSKAKTKTKQRLWLAHPVSRVRSSHKPRESHPEPLSSRPTRPGPSFAAVCCVKS
jgi:hypothetical protein